MATEMGGLTKIGYIYNRQIDDGTILVWPVKTESYKLGIDRLDSV